MGDIQMRRFLLCILSVALLFSLAGCADYQANTTGSAKVLSIGLSYKGTGASELRGTINDATEFGAAMDAMYNAKGVPRTVSFMLQEDGIEERVSYPTRDNIIDAIDSIEVEPNDFLVVYYSGHGQNVWFARCPVCGAESYVFVVEERDEEGNVLSPQPPEAVCSRCRDGIETFIELSGYLAAEERSSSQAAKDYIEGKLVNEGYEVALEEDPCNLTREILTFFEYAGRTAPTLSFELRGFFATAPTRVVPFEDFVQKYREYDTDFGYISDYIAEDTAMPDVDLYAKETNGLQMYHDALCSKLESYGVPISAYTTFEYYWNVYQSECWGVSSWTMLYMDELADRLESKGCRALLVADGCYSGFAVEGRDEDPIGFFESFSRMFEKRSYRNLTVVSASTSDQVSLDSSTDTEDGYSENHGLFTMALLNQIGWVHSRTEYTVKSIDGDARRIYGRMGELPQRLTVSQAMENIKAEWTYQKQAPQMNGTYLDTVLVP